MIDKLSRKVTIALVAIVLYCTIISTFIYIFDHITYFDYTTLWLTFFIISSPMFLIVGVAMAFLFDRFVVKPQFKGLLYTLVAGIVVLPYSAFISQLTLLNALYYFIFGAIAGIIFFIVQVLFESYFYTKSTKELYD